MDSYVTKTLIIKHYELKYRVYVRLQCYRNGHSKIHYVGQKLIIRINFN